MIFLESLVDIVEESSLAESIALASAVLAVRIVGRLSVLSTVAFHLVVVEEDIASPHFVSYGVDSAAKLAGNPPKRPLVLPTGLYDDAFRKCQVRPFPAGHISGRL